MNNFDLVYYHGGCPDGWCAAFVAWRANPDAELVPLSYGAFEPKDVIEQARNRRVIMVDFSLKTEELNTALFNSAQQFVILDHHHTAERILHGTPYSIFDMNRSGAGLTWDYFFGVDSPSKGKSTWEGVPCDVVRPWWVNYTEDQDLWRFKLPDSRVINNWLNVQERTVERWKFIATPWLCSPQRVKDAGIGVQLHVDYMTKAAMKDLQVGKWHGYTVGVVNNGHVGTSEIGEAIYQAGYDIAMMWREAKDGQMRFGLRSRVADVGSLAATFPGGGGHKASAGFELPLPVGRALLDKILNRGNHASIDRY